MKASDETLKSNRRQFIQYTGAMIGGMAFQIGAVNPSFASGSNILKVGLIGCGGRGAGAASQALAADPDTILTAMGDVFVDRLDESHADVSEPGEGR